MGKKLKEFSFAKPVVLGITRGGVVVAAEVAKVLKAPLYPLVIKKVSSPFNPEFAIGAVVPERQEKNLARKIKNRTVIIIDDGIATGWTLKVGIKYVRSQKAKKVIAAVPVADREIARQLDRKVERLVVLEEVNELGAVGNYYEDFSPVSDEEVVDILAQK